MSLVRDMICNRARYWASPGTWRPSASHLVDFFTIAGTEFKPTIASAQKSLDTLDTGCYLDHRPESKRHWCGIFACAVLKEMGVSVRWSLMGGNMTGPGAKSVWGHTGMRPGDVAIIAAGQHHFIVLDVNYTTGAMETVEGNTSGQYIRHRKNRNLNNPADRPYTFHRVAG